ncbi:DNA topoisomerase III [Cobetia sp. MMG027]|uniref:DNA topoisomerase III n=1 Tax=Cobetia sp. MMG027 TaxID=3021980 RepID=UPI0022FDE81D|nr:DNA topoisomerase III [Cobetia sp. MMG027]MDA5563675.1 DNA topoisomerase III [Cobetia sp. MMG027]
MRLIIAEKPSLARAIAEALPGRSSKRDGYIDAGDARVTWCIGHLLEQAPPDDYDERFKRWSLDHLPIIPAQWKLKPRSQARGQLKTIREQLKLADEVIHAGDPDREGQLLVQEVLEHMRWRGPVKRLLISDMNRSAVTRALNKLDDNQRWQPLYEAALARQRADWLYGMNLTRAWTLTGRQAGHDGVLSVGRVQTPLLGLVVRRDEEIEAFEPRAFFPLWIEAGVATGSFKAWWHAPSSPWLQRLATKGTQLPLDDKGRLLDSRPAERLARHLATLKTPGDGHVESVEASDKSQPAPLPYSLSALQVDAARRYRLPAQKVLDTCQALYERHQLITYPRSDCRYLPREHHAGMANLMISACSGDDELERFSGGADFSLRSRAFNDAKVSAHHALAPTGREPDYARLSRDEANLYRMITRNVLAQFYPAYRYREVKVELRFAKEPFRASGRSVIDEGWKVLFQRAAQASDDKAPADDKTPPPLPALQEGEPACVLDCGIEEKETRPPEPFNDASLIQAMMNIARYVEDDAVRRTLRDVDGLGTEATRAGMLETLINRGYLVRDGQAMRSTRIGRALIHALPDAVSRPERTALWEQRLSMIHEQGDPAAPFLSELVDDLRALLADSSASRLSAALASVGGATPRKNSGARKGNGARRKSGTSRRSKTGTSKTSTSKTGTSKEAGSGSTRRSSGTRKPAGSRRKSPSQ